VWLALRSVSGNVAAADGTIEDLWRKSKAVAIDAAASMVELATTQAFPESATIGIERWETMLGLVPTAEQSDQARRDAILDRMVALQRGDVPALDDALEALLPGTRDRIVDNATSIEAMPGRAFDLDGAGLTHALYSQRAIHYVDAAFPDGPITDRKMLSKIEAHMADAIPAWEDFRVLTGEPRRFYADGKNGSICDRVATSSADFEDPIAIFGADLFAWYTFDDEHTTDTGGLIDTAEDRSGNGRTATGSGATRPTLAYMPSSNVTLDDQHKRRGALFLRANAQRLILGGALADWKFLHETGGLVALGMELGSSGSTGAVFDTGGYSSLSTGFGIATGHATNTFGGRVSNGSGTHYLNNVTVSASAYDPNESLAVWSEWAPARVPLLTTAIASVADGELALNDASASGSVSTGNPTALPHVGQSTAEDVGTSVDCYVRHVVIVNAPTTQEQRERLSAFLMQR
jgi:hypothetical protein